MSSREIWRVFKHDDGYYYFDKQPKYKHIPLKLMEDINLNKEEVNMKNEIYESLTATLGEQSYE